MVTTAFEQAVEAGGTFADYRRGRKLAMTKEGMYVAASALMPWPLGRGLGVVSLADDDDISLGLGTGR